MSELVRCCNSLHHPSIWVEPNTECVTEHKSAELVGQLSFGKARNIIMTEMCEMSTFRRLQSGLEFMDYSRNECVTISSIIVTAVTLCNEENGMITRNTILTDLPPGLRGQHQGLVRQP